MDGEEQLDKLAAAATGASVTVENLRKTVGDGPLHRLLQENEQPEYLLRGHIFEIVDRAAPQSDTSRRSRKVASLGSDLLTVVTDKRFLVVVPRDETVEQITVSFSDISYIDTQSAPGVSHRLQVHTDDTAYYIDTSRSQVDEAESVREFAINRQTMSDQDEVEPDEVLNSLERLADLHERGALSDREFEQKKTELLDRI